MSLPMPHMRGFSTLELCAALGIFAILAALATPPFVEARRNAALSAAVDEVLVGLHLARSAAILRNRPAIMCLSDDGEHCLERSEGPARSAIVFLDLEAGSPLRLDSADERLRAFALPPQLTVRGSRATVTFWPTVRAGTPTTLLICHERLGRAGRAVVISRTGRPRATSLTASQGSLSCA